MTSREMDALIDWVHRQGRKIALDGETYQVGRVDGFNEALGVIIRKLYSLRDKEAQ